MVNKGTQFIARDNLEKVNVFKRERKSMRRIRPRVTMGVVDDHCSYL